MKPALKITDLHKQYPEVVAVNNLSLEIKKGEFYGLLGHNGAGKTSTIHCVTGLATITKGTIEVFGYDVEKEYQQARKLVGLSQQDIHMDPYFSIEETLIYQAGYFGIPRTEAKKRCEKLLKQFGVWSKREESYRKLSGGMKRKVEIAKALMHQPQLLILDEPTAGLDVQTRNELYTYLEELNKQGTTIILTTHYIEEAEKLCNRIGVMKQGELILEEETKKLKKQYKNNKLEDIYLEITGEST
ncbi:MAG: ABC transporter ATP-binding protein [Candidatus Woesearchaeota archaeon]